MRININLNMPFKNLNGTDTNFIIADMLANLLGGACQGNVLKFYTMASYLYKNKTLTIDEADFQQLYNFIENYTPKYATEMPINNFQKGQMLTILNNEKIKEQKM